MFQKHFYIECDRETDRAANEQIDNEYLSEAVWNH